MDHGSNEVNVMSPALLGVVVMLIVSLGSLILSYMLQYRVIDINAAPFAPRVLKGFGAFGICLTLVVGLAMIVLELYAPY